MAFGYLLLYTSANIVMKQKTRLVIVGHRGAKGLAPENTLASFEKALSHHVNEIELDVRVTKDGFAVLIHDSAVVDPAGNHLEVSQHTFKELHMHKPDLTTLDAAIRAINRRVPVIVELKPGVPTKPVIHILKTFLHEGWQPSDFRLASYSYAILKELHAVFPDITAIVTENWSSVRAIRRAKELHTRRISLLEYWLWSGVIRSLKRRGYEVYTFPPKNPQKERFFTRLGLTGYSNNPDKARKWLRYGIHGVITDFPDRFKH